MNDRQRIESAASQAHWQDRGADHYNNNCITYRNNGHKLVVIYNEDATAQDICAHPVTAGYPTDYTRATQHITGPDMVDQSIAFMQQHSP